MRLLRDNAQIPCGFPSFSSVSLLWSLCGIQRTPMHASRKAAPHSEWSIMPLVQARCRAGQVLCAPAWPPALGAPGQLLMSWPAAAHEATGSQPEVIQPQANFLWLLCSSPKPSLHAENAFMWDSDKDWQNSEITCCSFCSGFSWGGQEIPYGV